MGGLELQKRLASKALKVGISRVWIDPNQKEELEKAITNADIRKLISKGYIKAKKPKIKRPRIKVKKKRGHGSIEGKKNSRMPKKAKWIGTVRPLRKFLKELKKQKMLDSHEYRKLYLQIKSGAFRNRAHLKLYLKQKGILHENGS